MNLSIANVFGFRTFVHALIIKSTKVQTLGTILQSEHALIIYQLMYTVYIYGAKFFRYTILTD